MAVSDEFREQIEDLLTPLVSSLRTKRMFGGLGFWSGSHFFALIDDDVLYFKVDESNRRDFEARGMPPFCPYGEPGPVMNYYQVPGDVLTDLKQLRDWTTKSVAVAKNKPKRERHRKKKPT